MKKSLWVIIVVVAAFLGFMMGYSFPPFVETGFAGAAGKAPHTAPKIDKDMQDYYKNLYKEDE
ncbi:MAG: hypothetical protein A2010_12650 [Nitrospirae bacterium GWD2_57_9]|nr:MAG: hypothetical protein A2010_12650 [Nitrospirae bacterium GWD2_57_9]